MPKKMLHTRMEENDKEEDPNQMDKPNQKGYRNEKGKLGRKVGEQRRLKISCLWKRLKNGDGDGGETKLLIRECHYVYVCEQIRKCHHN